MKNRIVEVRKASKMSQEKFAEKLNLTRNFIGLIETGRRTPSDRTISDICREFSINEKWLRTGEGEMQQPVDDKLSRYVSEITDSDDEFVKSFIEIYWELDEVSKSTLKKIARKMVEKMTEK